MTGLYLWCGLFGSLMAFSLVAYSGIYLVEHCQSCDWKQKCKRIGLASLLIVASAVCALFSGWGFENYAK